MIFMNEYEVQDALVRHQDHPVLGPATRTLENLVVAANQNSDGWAYWPKPARAAAKLQALIQGGPEARWDYEREDATPAALRAAYAPLKAFRTRTGIDFHIVEVR